MNLIRAEIMALKLITEHCPEYNLQFDNAKTRFGYCNHKHKIISLSKPLVLLNDESIVKNTLLHEIAHALTPHDRGHGVVWRAKALELGCDAKRCCSIEEVNVIKGRFTYVCTTCGRESSYHKRLRRLRACGDCCRKLNGGVYSKEFLLKQKEE